MTPTATETGIEVYVPGPLRDYCGGASTVYVQATSVKAALEDLKRAYPVLYPNICDETGAVRRAKRDEGSHRNQSSSEAR